MTWQGLASAVRVRVHAEWPPHNVCVHRTAFSRTLELTINTKLCVCFPLAISRAQSRPGSRPGPVAHVTERTHVRSKKHRGAATHID